MYADVAMDLPQAIAAQIVGAVLFGGIVARWFWLGREQPAPAPAPEPQAPRPWFRPD